MKTNTLPLFACMLGLLIGFSSFNLPKKWFIAGDEPESYNMGTDKGAGQDGGNAATIQSNKKKIDGFGTLMQNCIPDAYKGKRVRMSGMMKLSGVTNWAGIWLRLDDNGGKVLGFDNLKNGKTDRSVSGTRDWALYTIVLDVPANTDLMAYGALLVGTGQIWFDKIRFEIVDSTVPCTGSEENEKINPEPANLDFED